MASPLGSPLHTPLCDLLGIRHPILSVGFGGGAGPELVGAVSNAGAFGVLGGTGLGEADIKALIEKTRSITDKPFGINFIIDGDTEEDQEWLLAQTTAAAALKPAAIVLFWGDPTRYVPLAHAHDVKVLIQVGSLEEARRARVAGVDAVIVQGIEAGGHVIGTTSIWELLPDTVRALRPLPILASGGIGDGEGIARAMAFGAQGVSLGTRFVASDEARIHPGYKQRIVDSRAEDTVYNSLYDVGWPNAPHRTLKNKTYADWVAAGSPPPGRRPGEGTPIGRRKSAAGEWRGWPRYASGILASDFEGDWEYAPLWAGESCSDVNDIKPAARIVEDLVREAEAAVAKPQARA